MGTEHQEYPWTKISHFNSDLIPSAVRLMPGITCFPREGFCFTKDFKKCCPGRGFPCDRCCKSRYCKHSLTSTKRAEAHSLREHPFTSNVGGKAVNHRENRLRRVIRHPRLEATPIRNRSKRQLSSREGELVLFVGPYIPPIPDGSQCCLSNMCRQHLRPDMPVGVNIFISRKNSPRYPRRFVQSGAVPSREIYPAKISWNLENRNSTRNPLVR